MATTTPNSGPDLHSIGESLRHMAQSVGRGAGDTASQASHAASDAGVKGRAAAEHPAFQMLARLGYAAKGLVYLIIGCLAFATAIHVGGATTDPQGALLAVYQHPFGKFLLIVVMIGFIGYALWQFARALFNLDSHDSGKGAMVKRVGYAVVGFSYLGLALATLKLVLYHTAPKGSNTSTQDWTARLLAAPGGVAVVTLVGLIVAGVAIGLFYEAWSQHFTRAFPFGSMNEGERKLTLSTGRLGIGAQGVVFVIIAIFLVVAALTHNPQKAQGLAGALATLAAQPFGPLLLGLVALGLIAYGVYSFVEARYRSLGA